MISIGSDNLITLTGLIDNTTGTYQNAATVTGTLFTAANASVATFNLNYVASTNGNYRGTIPAGVTATLALGEEYKIKVVAASSGNTLVVWKTEIAQN